MALSRHLSLQGLCVLLLGTMVGGQGKSCLYVLGPQQGVDTGERKGVWSCGATVSVFLTKKEPR